MAPGGIPGLPVYDLFLSLFPFFFLLIEKTGKKCYNIESPVSQDEKNVIVRVMNLRCMTMIFLGKRIFLKICIRKL